MLFRLLFLILAIVYSVVGKELGCPNEKTSIRSLRKRRHLTFPDGSNAQITMSLAKTFLTHAPSGWYMTTDLDVLFPLAEDHHTHAHFRRRMYHRQKREFWERMKDAFHFNNMDGHACVIRSICEAEWYLAPPGNSLVHDLLRAIFTAPLHEPEFKEEMGDQYNDLLNEDFCKKQTNSDCPFSVLHFILSFNKAKY